MEFYVCIYIYIYLEKMPFFFASKFHILIWVWDFSMFFKWIWKEYRGGIPFCSDKNGDITNQLDTKNSRVSNKLGEKFKLPWCMKKYPYCLMAGTGVFTPHFQTTSFLEVLLLFLPEAVRYTVPVDWLLYEVTKLPGLFGAKKLL